jgi:hypothetical protein
MARPVVPVLPVPAVPAVVPVSLPEDPDPVVPESVAPEVLAPEVLALEVEPAVEVRAPDPEEVPVLPDEEEELVASVADEVSVSSPPQARSKPRTIKAG